MTSAHRCLVSLAQRAETMRREEIRRCRPLRHDAKALEVAEQVTKSLVAALLRPIREHLTAGHDPDEAERCIRRLFALPDELERDVLESAA